MKKNSPNHCFFKKRLILRMIVFLFFLASIFMGVNLQEIKASDTQCGDYNFKGYAWSENIGWISFSCENNTNVGEDGPDYGVNLSMDTGIISGHAWSENIGWISFDSDDLDGCPSGECKAKIDVNTREISGWAIVLSNEEWISLSGTTGSGGQYGVNLAEVEFSGWAFGSDVLGWISFSCKDRDVCSSSNYQVYLNDKEDPHIEITPDGNEDWAKEDIDFSISCEDDYSGCSDTYYTIINKGGDCPSFGPTYNSANSGTVTCDSGDACTRHVCYAAEDNAGNVTVERSDLFKIDNKEPGISADPLPTGGWKAKSKFQVTVEADDGEGGSGVDEVRYRWNNDLPSSCTSGGATTSNNEELEVDPGENTLYLCVRDGAGNTNDWDGTYRWNPPPTVDNLSVTDFTDEDYCNCEDHPPAYDLFWDYKKPEDSTAEYAGARVQFEDNSGELLMDRTYEGSEMASPSELETLAFNTTYRWRVKVWDENGLESEWSSYHEFTTGIRRAVVDFSWVPLNPFEEEKVYFTNKTIPGSEDIIDIEWDFGENADPKDSTEDDPEVKFTDDGSQTVTLTVTDESGTDCYREETVGVRFELPDWQEVGPVGLQMLFLSLNF